MVSILGAILFGIVAIVTLLITLGFPLGEFSMGGKHKVVPHKLRIAAGISFAIQLFAIIIILQAGGIMVLWFSTKITKYICFFFAVYLTLNVFMNISSNSKKEKYFATPLSIVAAVCFWITALNI